MQKHLTFKRGVAWLCTLALLVSLVPGTLAAQAPVADTATQTTQVGAALNVPSDSLCNGQPELMAAAAKKTTRKSRAANTVYGVASDYKTVGKHVIWTTEPAQNQSGRDPAVEVLGIDVLINNISPANFNTWMTNMDKLYEAYEDLVGGTPVGGKQLKLLADTSTGAWAYVQGTDYMFLNKGVVQGVLQNIERTAGEDICT